MILDKGEVLLKSGYMIFLNQPTIDSSMWKIFLTVEFMVYKKS